MVVETTNLQPMRENNKSGSVRRILLVGTWTAVVLIGAASLAGFFGQLGAWFDIFANFRACYVVSLVILLAFVSCLKRVWLATSTLLLLIVNGLTFLPLYTGSGAQHSLADDRSKFRVLELNIFGGKNLDRERTIRLINQSNADLIGISEVTTPWMQSLQSELKQYPHQVYEPRFGGVALLSKFPLEKHSIKYFSEIQRPRIIASARVVNRSVNVILAHPVIPLYPRGSRDEELAILSNEARLAGSNTIIFGDLNVTPWSYNFNKMISDSGLSDSECGFGFQPTWCAFLSPFSMLFPIDHCLTTDDFIVVDRRVLGNIGSDHLPLQVDLALKK